MPRCSRWTASIRVFRYLWCLLLQRECKVKLFFKVDPDQKNGSVPPWVRTSRARVWVCVCLTLGHSAEGSVVPVHVHAVPQRTVRLLGVRAQEHIDGPFRAA